MAVRCFYEYIFLLFLSTQSKSMNNLKTVRQFLPYYEELIQELFPQADTEIKQDGGYRIHPAHSTLINTRDTG